MEELNYLGDDFLTSGEFHQLYSSTDYFEDICLWDNRILNAEQQQHCVESVNSVYYDWNSGYSDGSYTNNHIYQQYVDLSCDNYNFSNKVDQFESTQYDSQSILYQNSNEQYIWDSNNGNFNYNNTNYTNANFSETFLTDMDQWKQNHLDDLLYQTNNNNDWELNLENLLFDSACDMVDSSELPARTFYCNDSCTNFLQETSEHLDINLQNFRPKPRQKKEKQAKIQNPPKSNESTENANNKEKIVANEEKEFICTYGECRKVYAKAGHLKAHIRRHVGDKPYVCLWPNCTWKFSRSDELSRHRRSHSGIKPYKCDYCPKCFSRSDHLTKHRKVHERKMAALKIKAVWTNLPAKRPGRKPKHLSMQQQM